MRLLAGACSRDVCKGEKKFRACYGHRVQALPARRSGRFFRSIELGRRSVVVLTCAHAAEKSNNTMPRRHADRGDTRGSMGGARVAGNCSERVFGEQTMK